MKNLDESPRFSEGENVNVGLLFLHVILQSATDESLNTEALTEEVES